MTETFQLIFVSISVERYQLSCQTVPLFNTLVLPASEHKISSVCVPIDVFRSLVLDWGIYHITSKDMLSQVPVLAHAECFRVRSRRHALTVQNSLF